MFFPKKALKEAEPDVVPAPVRQRNEKGLMKTIRPGAHRGAHRLCVKSVNLLIGW